MRSREPSDDDQVCNQGLLSWAWACVGTVSRDTGGWTSPKTLDARPASMPVRGHRGPRDVGLWSGTHEVVWDNFVNC